MADITEVIRADHRRIQRLQGALRDADRSSSDTGSLRVAAHVWNRLAFLIEMNADAEQEICLLPMFGTGPAALEQVQDAVADLDDVRAAVDEARLQPARSAAWRRAVRAAIALNERHISRQEQGVLAAFRCRAGPELRRKLADEWQAFTSARITELVSPAQQDGRSCHFCEWPLGIRHRHVLDAQHLGIFCSCDVCHGLSRQSKIGPAVVRPAKRQHTSDHGALPRLRPTTRTRGLETWM